MAPSSSSSCLRVVWSSVLRLEHLAVCITSTIKHSLRFQQEGAIEQLLEWMRLISNISECITTIHGLHFAVISKANFLSKFHTELSRRANSLEFATHQCPRQNIVHNFGVLKQQMPQKLVESLQQFCLQPNFLEKPGTARKFIEVRFHYFTVHVQSFNHKGYNFFFLGGGDCNQTIFMMTVLQLKVIFGKIELAWSPA